MIDYARKFDGLAIKCGIVECERITITQFKSELRSEIQKKIYTVQYPDLQEVIFMAIMWETITRVLGPNQKVKESTRSKPKQKPEFPRQHDKKLE